MVNTRKGFKLTPTNKDKRIEELEKDLNYQKQARAIAEKAVMDLEKENAELKKKCYKKAVKDYCELEQEVKYQTEDSKKWQNMYKQRCEECQKLERENAELKDHLAEEVELHLHAEEYIKSLEQQIEKMRNCVNCKYRHCDTSSFSVDKDGNKTLHRWNEEKEKYCDVGKNGKYQCWEIKE